MNTSYPEDTNVGQMPPLTPLSLTSTARTLPVSPTLAIHEAVTQQRTSGHKIIHMGFGEASFPLHPLLKTALSEAATQTQYAPVFGIPALRQAIAAYLVRTRGIICSADQVVVGPGSKPLLYALLHILDGDLLLPNPSWVSYAPMAQMVGRRVISVQTDPHNHHRLTPQALSQAISRARRNGADPRILLVNSPSNPTGSMFDPSDVEALSRWAKKERITLISDEMYAELAHGWREHISPASFYPEGCIVTGGLSKAFSIGGWRLGYAVLPSTTAGKTAIAALRALASEIWTSTSTPIQEAALTALAPDPAIERYVHHSALVHSYVASQLYGTLTQLGVPCPRPAGGFYLYPDFSPWRQALRERGIMTSQDLAQYLLEKWNIATLPGSVFNEKPFALRLRLATSQLCEPEPGTSPAEREAGLWHLLNQAEALQPADNKEQITPSLPVLTSAQIRWTQIMRDLGNAGL